MKVGDLVKMPEDNYYWWGGKLGLVVGVDDTHREPAHRTLRVLVGPHYTKFGANFVELISEGR